MSRIAFRAAPTGAAKLGSVAAVTTT